MALLDIAGKLAKAPVYELLGGPTRNKVRALAWLGEPVGPKELLSEVLRARTAGFRAMVVPLRIPEGPARGRGFYRQAVAALESLRAAAGDDLDFVLDCGGRLTPAIAKGLARELEPFHLLWLDEPLGESDRMGLARLSAETVTPLGCGRTFVNNHEFLELLRSDAVDALRPDIGRHGITSIRKAAALAETYYVGVAPFHRGGPIATAAALHAAASMANFVIQELPLPADPADWKMRARWRGTRSSRCRTAFSLCRPVPAWESLSVPRLLRNSRSIREGAGLGPSAIHFGVHPGWNGRRLPLAQVQEAASAECAPVGHAGCEDCGAAEMLEQARPPTVPASPTLSSAPGRLKVTNVKALGVTWDAASDRPYVLVKIETDIAPRSSGKENHLQM